MNREEKIERLRELYFLTKGAGKHSGYQLLPPELSAFLKTGERLIRPHFEEERMACFLKHINPANQRVLDIGGNTGYFSFEFLKRGAARVDCYEGGKTHAEFLAIASDLIGAGDRFSVQNRYFDFKNGKVLDYDIILLLNVLHHVGDDYGDSRLTREMARREIIESLNRLSPQTRFLIFQLGFNWKGDIAQCLFEHGTKSEMIQFVKEGIKDCWKVVEIAVAEKKGGVVTYEPVNDSNIKRNDSLGEFLNRPVFILKSCLQ